MMNHAYSHIACRLHLPEPDYTRPPLEVSTDHARRIKESLQFLYGSVRAAEAYPELERLMKVYYAHKTAEMIAADERFNPADRFTEKDVIAITYGDLVQSPGKTPLQALVDMVETHLRGTINTLHILPFFPYSSDRGFAIVDYKEVDPHLGTWHEIEELCPDFNLMFDGVFNHVSSKNRWFQEFLNGNPRYQDFFTQFSTREAVSDDSLRLIFRPRTSDLLTRFDTLDGVRYCWTTFGPDQIDLNFRNEQVLLKVIEILLYYVRRGATLIRVDAAPYLWEELGTRCASLVQTHVLLQLMRSVLDVVAPGVGLVAECNVPHQENLKYLGDGTNEAQMIYNFALPPLVLHTFQTGNARALSRWARSLENVSDYTSFFNILDSHDGVGVVPVKGLIGDEELDFMIKRTRMHGGLVSYRADSDGSVSPYELNVTWYSALNGADVHEPTDLRVSRFIASRAIALVIQGVPGIYIPSLVGSRNDLLGVVTTLDFRSINRQAVDAQALAELIGNPATTAHQIAARYQNLIEKRRHTRAFHPNARQVVIPGHDSVFTLLRVSPDRTDMVLTMTNVTDRLQRLDIAASHLPVHERRWRDLITGRVVETDTESLSVSLAPYEVMWLQAPSAM